MADRLKEIPKILLKFWNKYTSKQKTMIISVVSTVILAFILLVYLMGRTQYDQLRVCDSSQEASQVVALLKEEGIKYKLKNDRVTVMVDRKRLDDAVLLLAGNDLPSSGMTMDQLLNNSLSTTNSDRTLKLNLFIQNQLRDYILGMTGVEDAQVSYIPKNTNNTILQEQEDTSASIMLKVNDDFEPATAETIAEIVASVIGNTNTDKIKVADQNGTLLFGGEKDLYSGSFSSKEEFKERLRSTFVNNLYMGLIKSGFEDVEIMPNLNFDMTQVEELLKEYIPAEGSDQGYYSHSYNYSSENAGYSGGIPGTSSNDGTDYMLENGDSNTGSVEIEEYDYQLGERVTNTVYEVGTVDKETSSMSIILRDIVTVTEEELEMKGLLEDVSFDEYVIMNKEQQEITVDEGIIRLVSFASGIPEKNIDIRAFQQQVFVPKTEVIRSWTDYLQIILTVLIVGLIIFVVFKSAGPVNVTELEPELSVEQLLATTKENQSIEDIDFNEVSEVRKMIEKFVDEKPDAVAQLLRNWLNEDWS